MFNFKLFEVVSLGRGGISEAASLNLRSFLFRKELGRPSLLRSADVTSKAKGWSSLPVLWFVVRVPRAPHSRDTDVPWGEGVE